jgi:hypothetical protein
MVWLTQDVDVRNAARICRSSTRSRSHHGFEKEEQIASYESQLHQKNSNILSGIAIVGLSSPCTFWKID